MSDNSALALNTKHFLSSYTIKKKDIQDCVDTAISPKGFSWLWEYMLDIKDNIYVPCEIDPCIIQDTLMRRLESVIHMRRASDPRQINVRWIMPIIWATLKILSLSTKLVKFAKISVTASVNTGEL